MPYRGLISALLGQEAAAADAQRFPPELVFEAGLRNHHVSNTAYPLAHDRTWGPYRVPSWRSAEAARHAWDGIDDLCLYVHIPFCETRCSFCEYTVVKREESLLMGQYMDDLIREFDLYRETIDTQRRTLHGFEAVRVDPSRVDGEQARVVIGAHADADVIGGRVSRRIEARDPRLVLAPFLEQANGALTAVTTRELESARRTTDEAKRLELYTTVFQTIANEVPVVFLYFSDYLYAQSRAVHGLKIVPLGEPRERVWNVEDWYGRTTRR